MMTYSPSPQLGARAAGGIASQTARLSATPPFPPVISKRHKRKTIIAERLNEINAYFTQNRETVYRTQMHALQVDMNYVNNAKLYENKPLEAIEDEAESLARTGPRSARAVDVEASLRTGKWAAYFVQDVNDAFEEKDIQLTLVVDRHNNRIKDLVEDHQYNILVAQIEHQRLLDQIRERVMQAVTNKKSTLLKDKDRPDLGDSSSLLFNSSQFGLSSSASPGGGLSNRKTRHTRHKLEVDDIGTSGNGSKRKRKTNIDANASSPEPAGRAALPDSILHWKDTHSKHESQQMTAAQVTVEDLFSQRELDLHLQSASHAAIDTITTKRRKISEEGQSSSTLSNAEASDMEGDEAEAGKGASTNIPDVEIEDPLLAAPEMDRTANSSMHQTRSTRNTVREVPIASFDIPSDLYGRATAISLIGTYNKERKKEEEYQRAPPLTDGEKENDLAMITAAIREEEASPGSMNKKARKDLLPAVTDYVSAAFQDSTNSAPFEKK